MADTCIKCKSPAHFGLNAAHCSNPECEDFSTLAPTLPPVQTPAYKCPQCATWSAGGRLACPVCGEFFY